MTKIQKQVVDKRERVWELFIDSSYYDLWCVRKITDKSFNSQNSFYFISKDKAIAFMELLKLSH